MVKKNILLTGSNGFLGKVLFYYLSKNNLVFTLNRKSSDYNFNLSKGDIYLNQKFDCVIHAAGLAHLVPSSKNQKSDIFNTNVNGTINLLNALSNSYLPKEFVFISSVSVYGLIYGLNITENSFLNSVDPYGLSKIKAEQLVTDWCKKNNIICTILRLPLVVGANPPGNLGAMINGIQNGYYFNIGEGKAKKSMVLAADVANSILKVSEIGGIYNLTDGYHPSFVELSNHISIQLHKRKPINIPIWLAKVIGRFGDLIGDKAPLNTKKLVKITSDLTFDDTKAREVFGWNPTRVLEGFKINL